MRFGVDKMNELKSKAKDAFEIARAMGTYRPEGVAILMASGLVVTGYTQPTSNSNAARDALRAVIPCFPSDEKVPADVLNNFTIAAVLVLTEYTKIQVATLATLREYPEVIEDTQIFHARLGSGSDPSYVNVQSIVPL